MAKRPRQRKPPPQTRDELAALFAEIDATTAAGKLVDHDDMDRAGHALVALSRLPADIAHQLGSGFGTLACWPPNAEILDFALSYEPPTSRDALEELDRAVEILRTTAHRKPALRQLRKLVALPNE